MRIRSRELAALAIVATLSGTATAQPIQYMFADSAGNYTNNFTIPTVGGFVDIRIYLNDTGNASSFFSNATQTANLLTNGLFGFGVRVQSSNVNVAWVPPSGPPNPNVTINPAFNGLSTDTGTSLADGNVTMNHSAGPPGFSIAASPTSENSPLSSRVLIATLRYFATGQGSTTLQFFDDNLNDPNTALANFASPGTNGGTLLDPNPNPPISGLFAMSAVINVPVPEPTSLLLGGLGVAGFSAYRLRRRSTPTTAA